MRADNEQDIGVLRPDETDRFLGVMCEAFEMEFEAAKPIFYSDPYFEAHNKYVLRLDGQIVSCLTVVDRDCWIGNSLVRVAGIAGVATQRAWRRQGLAGSLLSGTLHSLAVRGFHLSALFPTEREYYRRFGWETAGTERTSRALAQAPEADMGVAIGQVRRAATADTADLARIYDRASRGRAMHCTRNEKRWRYLLNYLPESLVAIVDGVVRGYVLCDYRPGATSDAPSISAHGGMQTLRILEIAAEDHRARALLHGQLAAQPQERRIEFTNTESGLVDGGFVIGDVARPSFMARVVNWPGLLAALAPAWPAAAAPLAFVLVDPILAGRPQAVLIRRTGDGVAVEPVDPASLAPTCRNIVVGDVGAWSATIVGHTSGGEACAAGHLKASNSETIQWMTRLFPARDPFIPAPDHF